MYIRTYVFVSFETTPVVRIQILIDPTFNKEDLEKLYITLEYDSPVHKMRYEGIHLPVTMMTKPLELTW